jgi:hypothetical protein
MTLRRVGPGTGGLAARLSRVGAFDGSRVCAATIIQYNYIIYI